MTAVLGGVAIWLGMRLGKEEEVTPSGTEAAINTGAFSDRGCDTLPCTYNLCSSGLSVTVTSETVDTETGEYTVTGNYSYSGSGTVTGTAEVYRCRCELTSGSNCNSNPIHCNSWWPEREDPDKDSRSCNYGSMSPLRLYRDYCDKAETLNFNLSSGGTQDFSITVQQASPVDCGSYQVEIVGMLAGHGDPPDVSDPPRTNIPGASSCPALDFWHMAGIMPRGVNCEAGCEDLTSDPSPISITPGEASNADLTGTVYTFNMQSVSTSYDVTSGFGSVQESGDNGTWSITAAESAQLSEGDSGQIQLLVDGQEDPDCVLPLQVGQVTEEPVCGEECSTIGESCGDDTTCQAVTGSGQICVGNDYDQCDIDVHLANSCTCPEVTQDIGCGDVCDATDDQCPSSMTCHPTSEVCVGQDYADCDLTTHIANECVCPEEDQPVFSAEKTAASQCINNDTALQVDYTITVTNVSAVSGTIEMVQDTYDSRFQSSWVTNINPTPDTHTGNVITWNNGGSGFTIAASASTTFSYQVTIPAASAGETVNGTWVPYTFENFAIVRPEEGNDIELTTSVSEMCQPALPPTGILDEGIKAVLLSLTLIVAGLFGMRYQIRKNKLK